MFYKPIAAVSVFAVISFIFACVVAQPVAAHHTYWLDKIAYCESSGDAWAVNEGDQPDGSASYGKYQFAQGTWDIVAAFAYREGFTDGDWSGVVPTHAPVEIQDEIARLAWNGGAEWKHWTNCAKAVGYPPAQN